MRMLTASEMRLQVYANLAYGAKGLWYYTYTIPRYFKDITAAILAVSPFARDTFLVAVDQAFSSKPVSYAGELTALFPVLLFLVEMIVINVLLGIFNLIPLPPLDGSWVASWGLPRSVAARYDRVVEPYGQWILLVLFATGALGWVLSPFVHTLSTFLYRLAL